MKTLFAIFLFLLSVCDIFSQVLISTNREIASTPDPSAIFHVADDKRGILLPRISLASTSDQTTINSPVEGVTLYDSSSDKLRFWSNNNWNKTYETSDVEEVIDITTNSTSSSLAKTVISAFPGSMPQFSINSNTSGWTDLNVNTNINITKTSNTTLIVGEGMAMINNTNAASSFQFAVGIFVDGNLKLVRKFFAYSEGSCSWKKFNISGVFFNLPVGVHQVKLYAYNLPKLNTAYSSITYGGNASTSCGNVNDDMAKIFLTAQLTQ